MRWPSKDPDDYMQPARWDVQPPRWLARRRGQPPPDPTAYWVSLSALMGGLVVGAAVAAIADEDVFALAAGVSVLAQTAVEIGWRLRRRRVTSRNRG